MGVISFRVSDDDEAALRRAGVNPGQLAKEHVEAEARRRRAAELVDRLASFGWKASRPSEDIIREDRDRR